MDFYDGAQQSVWDLKVPQDIQHILLLVHSLWVADVSHMDYQVLGTERGERTLSIQQYVDTLSNDRILLFQPRLLLTGV
jgi:hypothetical protein